MGYINTPYPIKFLKIEEIKEECFHIMQDRVKENESLHQS